MTAELKSKLRQATIGTTQHFEHKTVEFNGQKFDIRQPSIKARSQLRLRCTTTSNDGIEFDMFEFLVWSVIHNTYVPNTNDLVFDEADYDILVANPTGGFMDEFAEVAASLVNISVDNKKKNSAKTTKNS